MEAPAEPTKLLDGIAEQVIRLKRQLADSQAKNARLEAALAAAHPAQESQAEELNALRKQVASLKEQLAYREQQLLEVRGQLAAQQEDAQAAAATTQPEETAGTSEEALRTHLRQALGDIIQELDGVLQALKPPQEPHS